VFERGGYLARQLVLLVIAGAMLAGCAVASSPTSVPAANVSTAHPLSAPPLPVAIGFPQPRLPTSATPASLVGLSAQELTSLLGTPAWTRRENPAEVWQYRGTACVLDIYFYEESGTPRVLYAEARDEAAHSVTLAQCLERIEADRRPNPSS
jgi:hypothetical protein